jgi:hypothetical protein
MNTASPWSKRWHISTRFIALDEQSGNWMKTAHSDIRVYNRDKMHVLYCRYGRDMLE